MMEGQNFAKTPYLENDYFHKNILYPNTEWCCSVELEIKLDFRVLVIHIVNKHFKFGT